MAAPSTSTDTDGNGQVAEEVKEEVKAEPQVPENDATAAEEAKEDDGAEAPASSAAAAPGEIKKWPGWPGDNVFRLIVPVIKVGSIIGKKGELIKKLCEETRAKVRVLDGVAGTTDRIVRTP